MNIFYTYVYLDPRISGNWNTEIDEFKFEPFYVGKGKGKRYLHHKQRWSYTNKHSHKNHRIKTIIEDGYEPIVIIIREDISEEQALSVESKLIRELGTRNSIEGIKFGPLTNLKTDGVVQKYSDESRAKMSISAKKVVHKPHTEETKEKIRKSNKTATLEVRNKISKALKGKPKPDSHRQRMSILHKGKIISPEHRERCRQAMTGRKASLESKLKMTESQLCHWRIENQLTSEIFVVTDMRTWCKHNLINYQTFYGTMTRNKYHKGYKLLEKIYSPR